MAEGENGSAELGGTYHYHLALAAFITYCPLMVSTEIERGNERTLNAFICDKMFVIYRPSKALCKRSLSGNRFRLSSKKSENAVFGIFGRGRGVSQILRWAAGIRLKRAFFCMRNNFYAKGKKCITHFKSYIRTLS